MNEVEESFLKITKTKKLNIYLCGRQTGKSTFCRQQSNHITVGESRFIEYNINNNTEDLFIDGDVIFNSIAQGIVNRYTTMLDLKHSVIHIFLTPVSIDQINRIQELYIKRYGKIDIKVFNSFAVRQDAQKSNERRKMLGTKNWLREDYGIIDDF